jgi:2-oxoglutarate ferredoxin oxidoreductase subunit beta
LENGQLKAVTIGSDGVTENDLLVHDETGDIGVHFLLARMQYPDLPEPIGVFRAVQAPTYENLVCNQIEESIAKRGKGDLKELLTGKTTWTV